MEKKRTGVVSVSITINIRFFNNSFNLLNSKINLISSLKIFSNQSNINYFDALER